MIPVFPYQIRRKEDGMGGELLLRLKNGKSAYILDFPMEQARVLALEMRGLTSDHCSLHHLSVHIAESLGGRISHVILRCQERIGGFLAGVMCIETSNGLIDVNVNPAAALAMAIHMGLPIFLDGYFASTGSNLKGIRQPIDTPTVIPDAFRQFIEEMDQAAPGEEPLG